MLGKRIVWAVVAVLRNGQEQITHDDYLDIYDEKSWAKSKLDELKEDLKENPEYRKHIRRYRLAKLVQREVK